MAILFGLCACGTRGAPPFDAATDAPEGSDTPVDTDAPGVGAPDSTAPSPCPATLPQHVACGPPTAATNLVCSYGAMGCFCNLVADGDGGFTPKWVCTTPRCSDSDGGTHPDSAPVGGTACDPATGGMCVYSDSPRLICFCDKPGDPQWHCY